MPTGIYIRTKEHKKRLRQQMKIAQSFITKESRKLSAKNNTGRFLGENSFSWKGDDVGKRAVHHWVVKNLGKPDTCEHCGKKELRSRFINWANKDHKYKRRINDWLRLCVKCHRQYDIKNNNWKRK